jgi:hypothetical protein
MKTPETPARRLRMRPFTWTPRGLFPERRATVTGDKGARAAGMIPGAFRFVFGELTPRGMSDTLRVERDPADPPRSRQRWPGG